MSTDKAVLYAYENTCAPVPGLDNTFIVNYKENGEWKQKSFITLDGAYVWYYNKINELKQMYLKSRSR